MDMKTFMKVCNLVFFLLLFVLSCNVYAFANYPCAESELIINNKTLSKMRVIAVSTKGHSKLLGVKQGSHFKSLKRVAIDAVADRHFSLYRHTAEGEIKLVPDHSYDQIATLHYRFFPSNSVCRAEGAVTLSGQPTTQVLLRATESNSLHRAHLEFVLLPKQKPK